MSNSVHSQTTTTNTAGDDAGFGGLESQVI